MFGIQNKGNTLYSYLSISLVSNLTPRIQRFLNLIWLTDCHCITCKKEKLESIEKKFEVVDHLSTCSYCGLRHAKHNYKFSYWLKTFIWKWEFVCIKITYWYKSILFGVLVKKNNLNYQFNIFSKWTTTWSVNFKFQFHSSFIFFAYPFYHFFVKHIFVFFISYTKFFTSFFNMSAIISHVNINFSKKYLKH